MGTGASKIREQYVEFWRRFGIDARGEYGLVGAGSILRCGFLSFLTYFIPIALLKRKLRDPHHFRSAVAFGAFGASYRTFRVLISRLFSQEEKNRVLHTEAPLIAGAAASLVALAIDKSFISSVFVSWWGVRALRTIPIFQKNIEQTQFGPLAVMALASSILCPAGLKAPEEHHVSYRKFLTDYFECSGCKFEDFRFPKDGLTIGETVSLQQGLSTPAWYSKWSLNVVRKSLLLYGPLHLVWAMLRLPHKTSPWVILSNTARSVGFLSVYVCGLMVFLLADSKWFAKNPPRWHMYLWTPLPTLSLLFERPNRQAELAFFCLSHAINSLYNHARLAGWVSPNRFVGSILLMLATGRIMQVNARNPGRTMHVLFGEKKGRPSQFWSQEKVDK